MKRGVLVVLLICSQIVTAQVDWLVSIGDPEDDYAYDVAIDANGFAYTVGTFEGDNVNFALYGASLQSSMPFNQFNGFIRKSASDGSLEWVKVLSSRCKVTHVEVENGTESEPGYFVVSGSFWGTVDFSPNEFVSHVETSNNVQDMFVAKYDLNGNYIWHRVYGDYQNDVVCDIAIDNQDNVLFFGVFGSTVDFGNGNVFSVTPNDLSGVVHKLDVNGNDVWSVELASDALFYDWGGIDTDNDGNVFVIGNFAGALDMNPGPDFSVMHPEMNSYGTRAFFVKLGSLGDYQWSKLLGSGTTVSYPIGSTMGFVDIRGVKVDHSGNVIVTGKSSGKVMFSPTTEVDGDFYGDAFVAKYTSNGSLIWVNDFGGDHIDRGMDIWIDDNDDIYTTGLFSGSGDLDPTADSIIVNPGGFESIYVQKTDSSGVLIDAKAFGSSCDNAVGRGISLDLNKSVYIAGNFRGTGWTYWDAPYGDVQVDDHGGDDAIFFKLDGHLSLEEKDYADVSIYPNPVLNDLYVSFNQGEGLVEFQVFDMLGRLIMSDRQLITNDVTFDVSDLPQGMYQLKMSTNKRELHASFIKK